MITITNQHVEKISAPCEEERVRRRWYKSLEREKQKEETPKVEKETKKESRKAARNAVRMDLLRVARMRPVAERDERDERDEEEEVEIRRPLKIDEKMSQTQWHFFVRRDTYFVTAHLPLSPDQRQTPPTTNNTTLVTPATSQFRRNLRLSHSSIQLTCAITWDKLR